MKQLLFLFATVLLAGQLMANPTRTEIRLKDQSWSLDKRNMNAFNDVKSGQQLETEIEPDQIVMSMAALYLYGGAQLFSVYINNNEITNQLTGDDFHADITPMLESGTFVLKLIARKDLTADTIQSVLKNAQISLLNNVIIDHIEMLEDPFFGGKMVEVTVRNLLDVDVDGKLIAYVYEIENMELVTENNNCAFSRQGSEIVIDINFPEADSFMKGKQYLVDISLVDKEKNEEIIDELMLPVRF